MIDVRPRPVLSDAFASAHPAYADATLFDLDRLHFQHRVCRLSGVDKPPLETGMM